MARDDREVEAAVPSGASGCRSEGEAEPASDGWEAAAFGGPGRESTSPDLVEAGSGGGGGGGVRQSVWEALAAGSGFPEARSGVRRSGRFRRLGCGSTPPDLVEAGSGGVGGGGVQQSMGEALATGTRIHVP
uniref:DUF834 domain-containing protein n=1 Tax=Oryza rufipogon TaxID=4529 RepID=A0A0E0QHX4_ORYRU